MEMSPSANLVVMRMMMMVMMVMMVNQVKESGVTNITSRASLINEAYGTVPIVLLIRN